MNRAAAAAISLAFTLACITDVAAAKAVPSPDEFLGNHVGEDRYLAPYPKVLEYMRAVASASDRISVETAGRSTLGNEMMVVVVTSAANQKRLERYREISRKLANPDGLDASARAALAKEGKVIALVTCSIHSTEVGSTQMSMELVHEMATTGDPEALSWLDDVILLLMPSINPDGQVMVVDWYNEHLGTEFEGGSMPWLYHHYVGHDNNRDFYMLTQAETRVVNDVLYRRWYPQVFLDEHQMGATGPRMFVPPQADPLAEEVHSLIFRQADMLGTGMGLRLEEAGKRGVGSNMIFDSYWPGGTRNTAWWKNVTGLLTEVASARIASPVFVEPGELRGGAKGLPEYGRRANFPSPWNGGWWRLRDIIDYEKIATRAFLEGLSGLREGILANFGLLNAEAMRLGAEAPPYAFIVPPGQHDPVAAADLIDLLLRHGVRVHRATGVVSSGFSSFPRGSWVVPAAQPYRPFILTMLQPQRYPEVLSAVGGSIFEPYDVASWSLPLSMGVDVVRADAPLHGSHERVEEATWPGGDPGAAPGGWLIPRSADSAWPAMNRLMAEKRRFYMLAAGAVDGSRSGDVWIPADAASREEMAAISRDLHVPLRALGQPPSGAAWALEHRRVGIYKPWIASMDEGWTRFVLERYGFEPVSVSNQQIVSGEFTSLIDVLILPDIPASIIKEGKPPEKYRAWFTPLPPGYSGGLGDDGAARLKAWVSDEGGTIVAMNGSAEYAITLLELPVTNVLDKVKREEFNCPGSLLRLDVDTAHPLAFGMREEEAGFFADSPAFDTRPPDARFTRRVVASYPADEKDILVSGYLKGGELLERRAAVVEFGVRKGRAILMGLKPQSRAQTVRSFRLLFNAIYEGALAESSL